VTMMATACARPAAELTFSLSINKNTSGPRAEGPHADFASEGLLLRFKAGME